MSLMSVLNVGTRALQSSQIGIDITGQNIASADVEGYSRKRINLTTIYRKDEHLGQMGMGAQVVNIERMRNQFLDEQIRKQNSEVGYFTEVSAAFNRMEAILTEPSNFGIMHFMDEFFNSWQNLANNPEDISARTLVRTNAEILCETFRKTALELADLRQQMNDALPIKVARINQITAEIVGLNQEVASIEIGDQNANDSRDRRDFLLAELAQLIEINVVENQLGQITVTTAGSVLVAPAGYRQTLEVVTMNIEQPDGSIRRDAGIRFSESRLQFLPTGGELRGLIDSRDIFIPEYQARLDEMAEAIVRSINSLHVEGYNLDGHSGFNFFDPDGITAANMRVSSAVAQDVKNIAAATAMQSEIASKNTIPINSMFATPPVTAGAAGYVPGYSFGDSPMQLWRGGMPPMTSAGVQPGPTDTHARDIIANSVTVTVRTRNGIALSPHEHIVLKEGVDFHIDYQFGTFQMLHNGYDGEQFDIDFEYFVGGFQGPGDNSNALAIADLKNQLTMTPDGLGNPSASFTEYFSSVVGRLGLNVNQASSNLQTRVFLADQYQFQQDMIAGVSLDEEMANLIRFQHTYTAAARLITTTDRMLETLLNM